MAELEARISADASDLIKETRKASAVWGSFTKGLAKEGRTAIGAVKDISKGAGQLTSSLGVTARAAKKLNLRGVVTGIKGIGRAALTSAKGLLVLGGSLGRLAFGAVKAGASAALGVIKSLTKGAIAFSLVLTGIGAKAVFEFGKFQKAFAQVRTLVDESKVDIQSLETGVRDLAVQFGVNLKESTVAAYQAISAGVEPARVVGFLETAFRGAAAGAASVEEVTNLVTSALNAFNKPIEEASRVSDIFFATIKAGKTTASELAASIGQIAPIASATGVSLEEVGAGLATLTAAGLSTAEAATGLKASITAIIKPSESAAKALEAIGVSQESLRTEGLAAQFEKIRIAVEAGKGELNEFIPPVRAFGAAAVLAGKGAETFAKNIESTTNSAGEAQRAFAKTAGNISRTFGQLRASIQNAFVSLGSLIGPAIQEALSVLTGFFVGAQKELELLASAFNDRFGPQIVEFFESLRSGASSAEGSVTSSLRSISGALRDLSAVVRDNANGFGSFIATLQLVGNVVTIIVRAVRGLLAAAFTLLAGAVQLVLVGLRTLVGVFSDDLADSINVGVSAVDAFRESLAVDLADSIDGIKGDLNDIFTDVPETAGSAASSARSFGRALDGASDGARDLADDVNSLKAAQEAQRSVTEEATSAVGAQAAKQAALAETATDAAAAQGELATQTDRVREANVKAAAAVGGLAAEIARINQSTAVDPFKLFAESAGVAVDAIRGVNNASTIAINEVGNLSGRFAEAGLQLVETFGRGQIASRDFVNEINRLRGIEIQIVDPTVFDTFITQANSAGLTIKNFSQSTVASLAIVSNVLTGEFKKAGSLLVSTFADGKISSVALRKELLRLAGTQLGFSEIFRSVEDLASGFDNLAEQASEARGAIGTELRQGITDAKEALDEGVITFDEYLAKIRETGAAAREFTALTESQVVVFQTLREENKELADQFLELSRSISDELRPAFEDYVKAQQQGSLTAAELGKALGDLKKKNDSLRKATDATAKSTAQAKGANDGLATSLRATGQAAQQAASGISAYDQAIEGLAGALVKASAQQELQFNLLAAGKTNFFDATLGVRLLREGQEKLIGTVNKLGASFNDVGQQKLNLLTSALSDGIITLDQYKRAVESLANSMESLGSAAASAAQGQQGLLGFAGQFGNADAGASVFGISSGSSRGRVNVGAGVFQNGGPVNVTGAARVEAGEFVLSQRGLSDLGSVFAELLNKGDAAGGSTQTINNVFNTGGASGERDMQELAFKLGPAIKDAATLSAARSPIT